MKDPLFGNKVAFAVLFAILLIVGLPLLADSVFGEGGHHGGGHGGDAHAQAFPQYPIEVSFASSGEKAEEKIFDLGATMAEMTPTQGERAALACTSCHTFEKGGAARQGPNLWNVVGRPVGSVPGFDYTDALKAYGGEWTYDRLDCFLKNSQACVAGSAMVQKIRKDKTRSSILVFLSTLSDDPVPFPAPLEEHAEPHGEEGETSE